MILPLYGTSVWGCCFNTTRLETEDDEDSKRAKAVFADEKKLFLKK